MGLWRGRRDLGHTTELLFRLAQQSPAKIEGSDGRDTGRFARVSAGAGGQSIQFRVGALILAVQAHHVGGLRPGGLRPGGLRPTKSPVGLCEFEVGVSPVRVQADDRSKLR